LLRSRRVGRAARCDVTEILRVGGLAAAEETDGSELYHDKSESREHDVRDRLEKGERTAKSRPGSA
jgi:hypothetical protein